MATSQSPYPTKTQTVTLDSIPYHTILEGPSSAPLIILIHALMSNNHIWDSTVPALVAAGYRTLRYDHIGHNLTPPPQDPELNKPGVFSFDSFCHHLYRIVQTVAPGTVPAGMIGCSIGGVLVLRYQMLYPPPAGHATKIISCDAPGLKSLEESKPKWRARIEQWKREGSNHQLSLQTYERWFPDPVPRAFDKENALEIIRSTSLEGYEICAWATMNFDYEDGLDGMEGGEGVLVLVGGNDTNIGDRGVLRRVHERVKGSSYVLMEGVGHIPPLHWPGRFEGVVVGFLGVVEQ